MLLHPVACKADYSIFSLWNAIMDVDYLMQINLGSFIYTYL